MFYKVFVFLYIFNTFNRAFIPIVDLRYIVLLQIFILLLRKSFTFALNFKIHIYTSKNKIIIFNYFILLIILSNLFWINSPYTLNREQFINTIILYLYNFFSILVFMLYKDTFSKKTLYRSIIFSAIFLFLSLLVNYLNFPLPLSESIRPIMDERFSPLKVRVGGYAEDQNYATLCMVIFLVVSSRFSGKTKYIFMALALFGILLSFSKTIIIGILFSLLFIFFIKHKQLFFIFIILNIIIIVNSLEIFDLLKTLSTMSTRFSMWSAAWDSFVDNPLFGYGITSVRSNYLYRGGWYVQPHNNFIAILVDHGIFVFLLYIFYIINSYSIKDYHYKFLILIYSFLSLTSDLWVFPYPIVIMVVLPILFDNQKKKYTRIIV